MKDIIEKLFGPKYENVFAKSFYYFVIMIWVIFILSSIVVALISKDFLVLVEGIIVSFVWVFLFRFIYKINSKLFEWK